MAWSAPASALVRERGVGNDTPELAEIVPLPAPTEKGGVLLYGSLEPQGDVDYFRIPVPDDTTLAVTLLQVEGASFHDAVLYAVSPDLLTTHVSDDEGGGLAPNLVVPVAAGEAGNWAVGVGGFPAPAPTGNETFRYRLVVSWGNPSLEEPSGGVQTPPIDSLDAIAPGGAAVLRGDLTSPSDAEDSYTIKVPKGRVLVASVFDRTGDRFSDPVLELVGPAANTSVDDDGGAGLFAWLYDLLPGPELVDWQVRVKHFNPADQGRTLPYDLVVAAPGEPCDMDGDAIVSRNDVTAIFDRRVAPVNVVPLADLGDYDGSRKLTVLDSRACEVVCRNAHGGNCLNAYGACGLLGPELLLPVLALRAALRRSRRGRSR
jgi:hypothetical protein